jgi:DNA invertase Pin-like site-specific DNA recombinase
LLRAIDGVESGDFDGIVVAYLSRLTRSRSGQVIWDRVEAAGGTIHCAKESLDTSTPNGRFIRDIHLANATREREEHMDDFADRRAKTVSNGVWRQRQVPRGYTFAGPATEDGVFKGRARRLVPGPDADEVRRAFHDRAKGKSVSAIARDLGMTYSGAKSLLANRVYLGELRDGVNVNAAAHEPLVTLDEFLAAGRSIPRPGRAVGDRLAPPPALLSGLVRCAGCGHRMPRKKAAEAIYACRVTHGGGEPCPEPAAITARILDAYVEPIILAELQRLAVSGTGREVELAEAAVIDAEHELRFLIDAGTAAGLDAADYAQALRKRKDAVAHARGQVRAARAREPVLPRRGMRGSDAWDHLNATERNLLLQDLLSGVIVARAGKGRRVPLADRVRVMALDSEVEWLDTRHGDHAAGIQPIGLPPLGAPGVLA